VIDAKHLETIWWCSVGFRAARCVDESGERNAFAEVAPTESAGLECPNEIRNESFHAVTSFVRAVYRNALTAFLVRTDVSWLMCRRADDTSTPAGSRAIPP
jgi:hypothetical protein